MKESVFKYACWSILLIFVSICVYYICLNASWLIGDDDIVIIHTGMGRFYDPAYNIWPSKGRFFPLSYVMYNILPILFDGYISPLVHYIYHSLVFVIFSILTMGIVLDVFKSEKVVIRYSIALLAALFVCARVYQTYLYCWSTAWFGTLHTMAVIALFYMFIKQHNVICAIVGLFLMVTQTYSQESAFVAPLSLGTCGLLLSWKDSSKWERGFYFALIANALIFLIVYYFVCYIHIEQAYDPAHASGDTRLFVVKKILLSQKFIWPAIIVLGIRCWDVLVRKDKISIYDLMLLTAAACCLSGWILKLNWVLYYNRVILWALLPVIYYSYRYIKGPWTMAFMAVFALFYMAKIPGQIRDAQEWRTDSKTFMNDMVAAYHSNQPIYWLSPKGDITSKTQDATLSWLHGSVQNTMRCYLQDESYQLPIITEYVGQRGYIIVPNVNKEFNITSLDLLLRVGTYYSQDRHDDINVYNVQ